MSDEDVMKGFGVFANWDDVFVAGVVGSRERMNRDFGRIPNLSVQQLNDHE